MARTPTFANFNRKLRSDTDFVCSKLRKRFPKDFSPSSAKENQTLLGDDIVTQNFKNRPKIYLTLRSACASFISIGENERKGGSYQPINLSTYLGHHLDSNVGSCFDLHDWFALLLDVVIWIIGFGQRATIYGTSVDLDVVKF